MNLWSSLDEPMESTTYNNGELRTRFTNTIIIIDIADAGMETPSGSMGL